LAIGEVRKIILLKSGLEAKNLNLEEEEEEKIKSWAERVGLKKLLQIIKVLREAEEYFKSVFLPQLALEMAIMEMIDYQENDQNKNNPEKSIKQVQVKNLNFQSPSEIIQFWPQIIEEIKVYNSSLSAFLKNCVPLGIKKETIILGVKFKLYLDKIQEKREIIEKVISKFGGKNYSIDCIKISEENKKLYQDNLEKIKREEEKIESDLAKNTIDVFGKID